MISKRLFIIVLTSTIAIGCNGYNRKLDLPGGYILLSDNECKCFSISYPLGDGNYLDAIPGAIIELGYNDEYIAVKQNPYIFPNPPNKSIINYFIIPLKNRVNKLPDLNKIGPLTPEEFNKKKKVIKVLGSIVFKEVHQNY